MVALLRGVNVGGRSSLAMADLRAAAEACGYDEVSTYIQSGNLLLCAPGARPAAVAERLRQAIAETSTVAPEVVVRTRDELAAVIGSNPYAARGEDTAHLHVCFLAGEASAPLGSIDLPSYLPEEAVAVGREIHLFLPGGMGRSRLAADLARRKGPGVTTRNWRTVTRLLDLADRMG